MRVRDPKTGEVFRTILHAREHFCLSGKTCSTCEFQNCVKYSQKHPAEAARLMGYEVMEEKEDNMDKQDKPLSEWTLGEVQALCERRNGDGCCDECPFANAIGNCTLRVLPEEWELKDSPCLTEPEIAIMRAVGAKWVSYNEQDGTFFVDLWTEPPTKMPSGLFFHSKSGVLIASVHSSIFPSVKPGDCIGMEDAE